MRLGALDRLVPAGALKTQEKCLKSECQSGKIRSCHRNEKARWRPRSVLSLSPCMYCAESAVALVVIVTRRQRWCVVAGVQPTVSDCMCCGTVSCGGLHLVY